MPKTTQAISFRLDTNKLTKLQQLAEATDRPRSWHIEQALDSYLETQSWQLAHIDAGIASLETEGAVEHERVREWLLTWGQEEEDAPPE